MRMRNIVAGVVAAMVLLAYAPTASAAPGETNDQSGQTTQSGQAQSGQAQSTVQSGWVGSGDSLRWYENGKAVASHAFYDPASKAWYWADADGSIARDKDVFIPKDESDRSKGGKWVRFDANRHMVKGEDYRYGGWYWFDPVSGEMAKGMKYIPSNGGKWVYYDWVTGQMAHGEKYVNYDAEHTGWYLFDQHTGAMFHGDTFLRSSGGKWVRYDRVTGKMVKGLHYQDGAWYYFNTTTGKMAHKMAYVPEWKAYKYFDDVTGRWNKGQESADWNAPSQEGAYPDLSRVANLNVEISIANQQVYVRDGSRVIYTMITSTGLNDWTPRGNYTVNGRGTYFMNPDGMGARNWVRFLGPYLFHSVPIDRSGQYIVSEAKKLGRPASHGCARLTVSDSLWLYRQLRDGTPVRVY